jgi:CheY-like chemotaxis protein
MLSLILTSHWEYARAMRAGLLNLGGEGAQVDVELDALRAMKLLPHHYDLILIDRVLNTMDGLQLLLLFKQQAPNSKFVIVGDQGDEASRAQAYQNGADFFLVRPATPAAFKKSLEKMRTMLEAQPPPPVEPEGPLMRLSDMIQTRCLSGDSVLLQVRGVRRTGEIFIQRGEVFHAQYPGKSGVAAFYEMLQWDRGLVRLKALALQHLPPRTIEVPYQTLLKRALDPEARAADLLAFEEFLGEPAPAAPVVEAIREAPPLVEAEVAPPAVEFPAGETPLPQLNAHWKINLMGELVEGSQVSESDRCAFISYFFYRKLADIAVALEVDYFNHMTLWGSHLQQVLVADNLGVRHAVFETPRTEEKDREQYVKWCCEQSF